MRGYRPLILISMRGPLLVSITSAVVHDDQEVIHKPIPPKNSPSLSCSADVDDANANGTQSRAGQAVAVIVAKLIAC